jgi:hypothetical protein
MLQQQVQPVKLAMKAVSALQTAVSSQQSGQYQPF